MNSNALVNIGEQRFDKIIEEHKFYIDKTAFIREWWDTGSTVSLITRPRRFGKTLNMSMLECFFSNEYAGRGELFERFFIWKDEKYRQLQGTYPVIFLSFAGVKTENAESMKLAVKQIITKVYGRYRNIMKSDLFDENDRKDFASVNKDMDDVTAYTALNSLCIYLKKFYGKDVIILLDEYDTPMQEAWLSGYWDKAVSFFSSFFDSTFKANPNLQRGIITGVTRISKESIFSDLNNLDVITTTSSEYATAFGFTEEEVFAALDDVGLGQEKQKVKEWYDGFCFGSHTDIYNPWSITSFIRKRGVFDSYWTNTSGNGLVNSLIQSGGTEIKQAMEELLQGKTIEAEIDEQIVFNQLDGNVDAVWSLLLATGYLKVLDVRAETANAGSTGSMCDVLYTLALTNYEVRQMFRRMVKGWFRGNVKTSYSNFIKALLTNDVEAMNEFMNRVAMESFSSFDTAKNASKEDAPERFYHGFVLGLMVELSGRFRITSNRESGFGRYDIMLIPVDKDRDCAYIIEFKVHKPKKEKDLRETVANARAQIDEKQYETELIAKGFSLEQIRKYGFAFKGKECLIG